MFIDQANKVINYKIAYCGPGLAGRSTNLQYIYDSLGCDPIGIKYRSEFSTFTSEEEGFIKCFSFVPPNLSLYYEHKIRLHLCRTISNTYHPLSEQLLLNNIDGFVFIADSMKARNDANLAALITLKTNLHTMFYDFDKIPQVFQLNKRDLPNIMSKDDLIKELSCNNLAVVFEAIAYKGIGVFESLKSVIRQIFSNTKKQVDDYLSGRLHTF